MEGGGEKERRGQGGRRKMKRWICWTDNSNKTQVILREEGREGERAGEGGRRKMER